MTKTAFTKLIAAILAGAMMTLGLLSCGMTVRATDLMAGIEAADAFDSQALIQLRREYCEKRKCIYCRFGHRMLSAEISR